MYPSASRITCSLCFSVSFFYFLLEPPYCFHSGSTNWFRGLLLFIINSVSLFLKSWVYFLSECKNYWLKYPSLTQKNVVSILAIYLILICPGLKRSSILSLLKEATSQMVPFLALRKTFFFPPEEFRVKVMFVLANEWDVCDVGCVCVCVCLCACACACSQSHLHKSMGTNNYQLN